MTTFAADICRDCGRKEGNYSNTKLVSCNSCHELSCQNCLFTQGCAWCQKTETFNTQLSDTNTMQSEDTSDSRPFFNPKSIEPYDLSEQPSGSEVSYGAEWGNHRLDGDGYCDVCDAYGLNCIEQGGNSPESIAVVEDVIRTLENSIQRLREAGITDLRELQSAIKQAKLKMYSMMNENRCTCDREYGEADPDCMACLNEWRNQRYGPDIHDVECVCNDCSGNSRQYAESFSAESPEIWVLQEQTRHGTTVSLHNAMLPSQPYLEEFDGNVEDFEEGEFGWNGYFGNDWFYISCTKETSRSAESFSAELKRDSCCCGATKSKPCACMYEGVMKCSATAPMCPCYKALAKKAEDETIIDSQETKGITANTKQYKDYDYDIDKMRETIDEPVRNAVDTDDKKHELIGAFKAGGVFLAAMVLASGYNKYKNRN